MEPDGPWLLLASIEYYSFYPLCSLQTGPEGGNKFCTRDRILIDLLSRLQERICLKLIKFHALKNGPEDRKQN